MRVLCEKPPKGFEKYFKPGGSKPEVKENKEIKAKEKDGKSESKDSKDTKVNPKPSTSSGSQSSKPYEQWGFGLFGGTGNRYLTVVYVGSYNLYFLLGEVEVNHLGRMKGTSGSCLEQQQL